MIAIDFQARRVTTTNFWLRANSLFSLRLMPRLCVWHAKSVELGITACFRDIFSRMLWLLTAPQAGSGARTGPDSSLFSVYPSGSRRMVSLFLLGFLTISCEIASPPKRKSELDLRFVA
jgi:hypothetical protein